MYFGTGTSGLNSKDDLNFGRSFCGTLLYNDNNNSEYFTTKQFNLQVIS